jgi:hypothetical protein
LSSPNAHEKTESSIHLRPQQRAQPDGRRAHEQNVRRILRSGKRRSLTRQVGVERKLAMQSEHSTSRQFWWAVVRLLLAVAQIAGATASLIFLINTGASSLTVVSVVATGLITLLSRILFSRSRDERGK